MNVVQEGYILFYWIRNCEIEIKYPVSGVSWRTWEFWYWSRYFQVRRDSRRDSRSQIAVLVQGETIDFQKTLFSQKIGILNNLLKVLNVQKRNNDLDIRPMYIEVYRNCKFVQSIVPDIFSMLKNFDFCYQKKDTC